MTQLEFETFTTEELQGRWPKWQTTRAILHDWYSVLRYYTVEQCTQAVQEHRLSDSAVVFEPKIQEVRRILKRQERRQAATVATTSALVPYVRCIQAPPDHPEWEGQEWVRLEHRPTAYITSRTVVAEAARMAAADIEAEHGGRWTGVVRPEGYIPEGEEHLLGRAAAAHVRREILDGPNGPGRRFLMGQSKGVTMRGAIAEATKLPAAVAKPPKTTASRAEIDRLMTPHELPPAEHADMTDEEFFAAHPVEQDGGWEQG